MYRNPQYSEHRMRKEEQKVSNMLSFVLSCLLSRFSLCSIFLLLFLQLCRFPWGVACFPFGFLELLRFP